MKELKLGITGEAELVVTEADTAWAFDESLPKVFSTPKLLAHLEHASVNAIKDFYGEGELTVGLSADFVHMAATPVGVKVTSKAELIEIDGSVLTFNVTAFDEKVQVAKGTHKRAVINKEKFEKKLAEKYE